MQNRHNKIKWTLLCLTLGAITLGGTTSLLSPSSQTSAESRQFAGDGQETHGGKGTKTRRLIAGDGQETHGGKGTKTA